MNTQPPQVPDELRGVPRPILEEYVQQRIRQFVSVFAHYLSPSSHASAVEAAWAKAQTACGAHDSPGAGAGTGLDSCSLKFRHRCRFLGCLAKDCMLCKNNPCKFCQDTHFDECYADSQVLRAKCEAEVYLELSSLITGQPHAVPGVEVQLCVVDGESWSESSPNNFSRVRRLLKSDEGQCLLSSLVPGHKPDSQGFLYLKLQEGQVKLPDLAITDKNDTFHMNGSTFPSFRVMGCVVTRDLYGNPQLVDSMPPAMSSKFIVKTQRALNDYRKSEYPHYKDELTKLKFIGSITAQRLREIQTHLGPDVPFTSIESVEQLKQLMLYADQHRQVENKLLELLNMKGKHKQKWDYLREVLSERIVYDDITHRAWHADESMMQGLLFSCKQGQVNMEKPVGIFKRVQQVGGSALQVFTNPDSSTAETMRVWRVAAEQAWWQQGHGRWAMAQERLDVVNTPGTSFAMLSPSSSTQQLGRQRSGTLPGNAMSPSSSTQQQQPDGMEEAAAAQQQQQQQMMAMQRRNSTMSSPHLDTGPERPSSVHSNLPMVMDMGPVGQPGPTQPGSSSAPVMGLYNSGGSMQAQFGGMGPYSAGPTQADMFRTQTMMDAQQGALGGSLGAGPLGGMMGGVYHFTASAQQQGMMGSLSARPSIASAGGAGGGAGGMAAPQQQHDMFNINLLSTRDGDRPSRSSRYRRMSADAMSGAATHMQSQPQLHTVRSSAEGFPHIPPDTGLLKRPRSSAPSGLYTEDMHGLGDQQALLNNISAQDGGHADPRSRFNMYHLESHGRHLPRGRKSQENLAAPTSEPMPGLGSVFDHNDVDLESLLQGIDSGGHSSYGGASVKQERNSPNDPLLLMGMGLGGGNISMSGGSAPVSGGGGHLLHTSMVLGPQGLQPGPQQQQPGSLAAQQQLGGMLAGMAAHHQPLQSSLSWQQQELTHNLHATLTLGEHPSQQLHGSHGGPALGPHFAAQHGMVMGGMGGMPGMDMSGGMGMGAAMGRAPMLMMPEGDSFTRLTRVLCHSDSDSFKQANNMLGALQHPMQQGPPQPPQQAPQLPGMDNNFERAVQDVMQGRSASTM